MSLMFSNGMSLGWATVFIVLLILFVLLLVWLILKQGGTEEYKSRIVGSLVSAQDSSNVAKYGGVSGVINHYRKIVKIRIESYGSYHDKDKIVKIYTFNNNNINNNNININNSNYGCCSNNDHDIIVHKEFPMKKWKRGWLCRANWYLTRDEYQLLIDGKFHVSVCSGNIADIIGTIYVY